MFRDVGFYFWFDFDFFKVHVENFDILVVNPILSLAAILSVVDTSYLFVDCF